MAACEKCWADAYDHNLGYTDAEKYQDLVDKRTKAGRICSPKEQAGQYWDEEKQCDSRDLNES